MLFKIDEYKEVKALFINLIFLLVILDVGFSIGSSTGDRICYDVDREPECLNISCCVHKNILFMVHRQSLE